MFKPNNHFSPLTLLPIGLHSLSMHRTETFDGQPYISITTHQEKINDSGLTIKIFDASEEVDLLAHAGLFCITQERVHGVSDHVMSLEARIVKVETSSDQSFEVGMLDSLSRMLSMVAGPHARVSFLKRNELTKYFGSNPIFDDKGRLMSVFSTTNYGNFLPDITFLKLCGIDTDVALPKFYKPIYAPYDRNVTGCLRVGKSYINAIIDHDNIDMLQAAPVIGYNYDVELAKLPSWYVSDESGEAATGPNERVDLQPHYYDQGRSDAAVSADS